MCSLLIVITLFLLAQSDPTCKAPAIVDLVKYILYETKLRENLTLVLRQCNVTKCHLVYWFTSFLLQGNKDEKDEISPKVPEEECIPCGACEAIKALKMDEESSDEESEDEYENERNFGY